MQRYIPDELCARLNAPENIMFIVSGGLLSLAVGALGEITDLCICMSICGVSTSAVCWLTVWRRRHDVKKVYEHQK